jgi:hypothetical protein
MLPRGGSSRIKSSNVAGAGGLLVQKGTKKKVPRFRAGHIQPWGNHRLHSLEQRCPAHISFQIEIPYLLSDLYSFWFE